MKRMKLKTRYIGTTAFARSGKDTFCDIAMKQIAEKGLTVKKYALAYHLKNECRAFCMEKFGIDSFTTNTEEKTLIRPILVAFGDVKRPQTQGRYFTDLLTPIINADQSDVILISDIRYAEYEKDEDYWLQTELGGKLVHIKAHWYDNEGNKQYMKAPNINEERNDPKLQDVADCNIDWELIKTNVLDNPYLNLTVESCLNEILFAD